MAVVAAAGAAGAATAAAAAFVGKEGKLPAHEKLRRIVGVAAEACERNDAVGRQRRSRVNADVADDDGVNIQAVHEIGNGLMPGFLDLDYLLGDDLGIVVICLVDGEHLGVAEVLDYALKVDYWDVDALSDAIYALITYPALAKMFAEKGLDEVTGLKWDNAAAKIKAVYQAVIDEAAARQRE